MIRVGLLGASFNPPHEGHLHISLEARKRLGLQQIWWLPIKQNPLKPLKNRPLEERLALCRALVSQYYFILVKDEEGQLKSNYSYHLIVRLIKKYRQVKFFWITGADNLLYLHRWYRWKEIIRLVPLVICDRDNYFYPASKSKAALYCKNKKPGRCVFLKGKKYSLSSTQIRAGVL